MATVSPRPRESTSNSPTKKHKSSHNSEKKRKRQSEEDILSQKKSKKHHQKEPTPSQSASQPAASQNPLSHTPFHTQSASLYLPLAPISQRHPLEGLCAEHISPLLLSYYPPLHGVILSYSNPQISNEPFQNPDSHEGTLLKSIDEYATSWAWVTVDFLLFKPEHDGWLEGYVNLQNEGHLGIVCWNLFNASIESSRLPKDWKWVGIEGAAGEGYETDDVDGVADYAEDGIGHYVDGDGKKIGETIRFRIKDIEASHDRERGFLSIAGTMLGEEEEAKLQQNERANNKNGKAGRRLGGMGALGATNLGVPREPDEDESNTHR